MKQTLDLTNEAPATSARQPYDQRKVQIVAGFMACFAARHYQFDIDIKISTGVIDFKVTDFQRGQKLASASEYVDVWSCPNDHHAYDWGYQAALRCICAIEHKAGRVVQ